MYLIFFLILAPIAWASLLTNRGYLLMIGIICALVLMLLPFSGDVTFTTAGTISQHYVSKSQNGSQTLTQNANTTTTSNETTSLMHFGLFEYNVWTYLHLLLVILLVFRWVTLNYKWGESSRK